MNEKIAWCGTSSAEKEENPLQTEENSDTKSTLHKVHDEREE